jgi:hypothetical protein
MPEDAAPEQGWDRGWEGHRRAQMRRLARLTLAQKLAWLEEAHRLVRAVAASRKEAGR